MTDPIEIMARTMLAESEFLADSVASETLHRCIGVAITALIEAGYAIVPASGTVDMVAAFWRQKNTGSQEVGHTGPDTHDMAAMQAAIEAGKVKP